MGREPRRRRRVAWQGSLVIVSLIAALSGPGFTSAQEASPEASPGATPVASPVASPVPVAEAPDLAAMMLRSADLDDEFGLSEGALWNLDTEVAAIAGSLDRDADELRDELTDAGWQARYLTYFGVPDEDDPAFLSQATTSYVTAYGESDGAEAGFELTEDESADSGAEDLDDAPELGEQSEVTRTESVDEATGNDFVSLDLSFRVENLVAGVSVTGFTGEEPDVDGVVELAEIVEERIQSVLDGEAPGLFNQIQRIEPGDSLTTQFTTEFYELIDGDTLRFLQETNEDVEPRAEFLADNNVEANYQYEGYFLPEDVTDPSESLAVVNRLYTFASEEDAAAFVSTASDDLQENVIGYENIEELDDLPAFDGEATGVSYDYPIGDDVTASGFRYWVQVGTTVVSMQADIVDGVSEDGVVALVEAQVACVEQGTPCEPAALPDDLLD